MKRYCLFNVKHKCCFINNS